MADDKIKKLDEQIKALNNELDSVKHELEALKNEKTYNPVKILKNKRDIKEKEAFINSLKDDIKNKVASKKKEIERIKQQEELKRKNEEEKIKRQQIIDERKRRIKELISNNSKKVAIGISILVVVICSLIGLNIYNSSVHSIDFYTKEDSVYIGDELNLEYEINPKGINFVPNIDYNFNKELYVINNDKYFAASEGDLIVSVLYNNNSYDQKTIHINPIELENFVVSDVEIVLNNSKDIEVEVIPYNATHSEYILTSNDNNIVKVEGNTLYGVGEGTATVTISSKDGKVKNTFIAFVANVEANTIDITNDVSELIYNNEYSVDVKLSPEVLSNYNYELLSSNPNVLKVDGNVIIAVETGNAILTAKYSDTVFCEREIVVKYPPINEVEITSYPNSELFVGNTYQLKYKYLPEKASENIFEWKSDDDSIAKVNNNGLVTAVGVGHTLIHLVSKNGVSDSVKITVIKKSVPTVSNNETSSSGNTQQNSNTPVVVPSSSGSSGGGDYILNTNTHKFHYPTCKDVSKMKEANKSYSTKSRDELIAEGYSPCGHCKP